MSNHAQLHWREDFDEPWRRLPWVILAGLIVWIAMLGAFTLMLEQKPPPEPPPTTIEARIVELPPSPAGLQGGGAPAAATAIAHPAPPLPKPVVIAKPKPPPHHHVKKVKPHPVIAEPPSPFGTAKHVEEPAPESRTIASKGPSTGATGRGTGGTGEGTGGIGRGTGSGSGAGIGSDNSGARAMYAPTLRKFSSVSARRRSPRSATGQSATAW